MCKAHPIRSAFNSHSNFNSHPSGVSDVSQTLVSGDVWWLRFAKEPYERDDILQKRPVILRSLLIVATPYQLDIGQW